MSRAAPRTRTDRDRPGSRAAVSWDNFQPARRFQALWVGLAVVCALPALVLTYLRVVPPVDDAPALVASFISYAVPAYLVALCCFVVALTRARRRAGLAVLTAVTALLLACHVCWVAPLFVPDGRRPTTTTFALMSLNLHNGGADVQEVAQRAERADVVVLLEATDVVVQRLRLTAFARRFPYSAGQSEVAAGGTVAYSRYPISAARSLSRYQFQQWIMTVAVPQIGPVRLIAAHPCNPYCGSNYWYTEHQQLRAVARENLDLPLIVAGDLNAVDEHGPLRAMRSDGMESVTDILGAGWLPTYPAGHRIPPLLPIDHILLDRFLTATSVQRFAVADTDHLGLMAQIAGAG